MIHLTALKPQALAISGRWWCVTIDGAPNALMADYSAAQGHYDDLQKDHPTWVVGLVEVLV